MEMAPSASFFRTKHVLNGSINRNSLCRDILFFSNFRPFAESAAETREPGLGGSLQGPLYYFFLLREKGNKVTLPQRRLFSLPLPALTPSFPGLFLPHLAECRCQTLVATNSLRRVRREEREQQYCRVGAFGLCSELPANTREPPGDRRDGGQGKERCGWSKEKLLLLCCQSSF